MDSQTRSTTEYKKAHRPGLSPRVSGLFQPSGRQDSNLRPLDPQDSPQRTVTSGTRESPAQYASVEDSRGHFAGGQVSSPLQFHSCSSPFTEAQQSLLITLQQMTMRSNSPIPTPISLILTVRPDCDSTLRRIGMWTSPWFNHKHAPGQNRVMTCHRRSLGSVRRSTTPRFWHSTFFETNHAHQSPRYARSAPIRAAKEAIRPFLIANPNVRMQTSNFL
jgi:hypothetical protein